MFSPTSNSSTKIDSVSGIMYKSESDSRFIKFHGRSSVANQVFHVNGAYLTIHEKNVDIIVLQVMILPNDELLIEYKLI